MLNDSPCLDRVFHALADSTRRAMVERLALRPMSVSELASPFAMSLPAVMQHLAVLEESGLVRSHKAGRVRTCRIDTDTFGLVERWTAACRSEWEGRLDKLEDYINTLKGQQK